MSVETAVKGAASDALAAPKTLFSKPILFISIGLLFLIIVVAIEVFKPGFLTDPIRNLLGMAGVKAKETA